MRTQLLGLLLGFVGGCTLLNSENGLVGPPLAPDAGKDGSGGGPLPPLDGSTPADGGAGSTDAGTDGNPADATTVLDSGPDSAPDAGPTAIYTGRVAPLGIAVLNGTVCWVEGITEQSIVCAPAAGADPSQIMTLASSTSDPLVAGAFDVALDATYLYWSNGPNNQVLRKALSGGTSAPYLSGGGQISYIVLDGTNVWFTDYVANAATGSVLFGPSATGSSNSEYANQTQAAGIGVYSGTAFWGRASPSSVSFGPELSHGTSMSVATTARVTGLALDGSGNAYFLVGNQQIFELPLGASAPLMTYDTGASFGDSDLAVDDGAVYWTEQDLGQIMRMAK